MSDTALFDIDDRTGDPNLTHVLMPNMAYACGGNILTTRGHFNVGTHPWNAVTCPECRAPGQDALQADIARQQGHQAGAV